MRLIATTDGPTVWSHAPPEIFDVGGVAAFAPDAALHKNRLEYARQL